MSNSRAQKSRTPADSAHGTHQSNASHGVNILRYNGNMSNQFNSWKESFSTEMTSKHGESAILFRTGEYAVPTMPERPSDQLLANDVDKSLYLDEMKRYSEKKDRLIAMRPMLYSDLKMAISKESLGKVKESVKWEAMELAHDPMALWKEICAIHVSSNSGNVIHDRRATRRAYAMLLQGKSESLLDYYDRFNATLKAMEAVGQPHPPAKDMAVDFLYTANMDIFGELLKRLAWESTTNTKFNLAAADGTSSDVVLSHPSYPETVAAAYQRANDFLMTSKSSQENNRSHPQSESAFLSDGKTAWLEPDEYKKKLAADKKNREAKQDNSKSKKQSKTSDTCGYCGHSGHKQEECNKLKKLIDEFKSETLLKSNTKGNASKQTVRKHKGNKKGGIRFTDTDSDSESAMTLYNPSECIIVTHTYTETLLASGIDSLRSGDFLCDGCASAPIVRDRRFLTNVRPLDPPIWFTGVGGRLEVNLQGDFGPFGPMAHNPDAIANILSIDSLPHRASVTYDHPSRQYVIQLDGLSYIFQGRPGTKGLPVCNFDDLTSESVITTVAQNMSKYSKRELAEAQEAALFEKRMAYPSPKALADSLRAGTFLNNPVTTAALTRVVDIYGPSIQSLKGKTTFHTTPTQHLVQVPRDLSQLITLFVDIMTVAGQLFLVSYSEPLHLLGVTALESKATSTLRLAVNKHLGFLYKHNYRVGCISSDNESGLPALEAELAAKGIRIEFAAPGQHVGAVERQIRTIKDRCRAIISGLPYALSKMLVIWLVLFVVTRINMMPHGTSTTRISPTEAVQGRKLDYKRHIRVSFGDYAQFTDTDLDNTMSPRTRGGIAIAALNTNNGSVRFYAFDTKKIVTRDKFTVLPTPTHVINHMNMIADLPKQKVSQDPTFSYHGEDFQSPDPTPSTIPAIPQPSPMKQFELPLLPDEEALRGDDDDDNQQVHIRGDDDDDNPQVHIRGDDDNAQAHIRGDDDIYLKGADMIEAEEDTTDPLIHESIDPASIPLPDAKKPRASPYGAAGYQYRPYNLRDRKVAPHALTATDHVSMKVAVKTMGDRALKAIYSEVQQMVDKTVWHPVHRRRLPSGDQNKVIRSSCFLKEKYDAAGGFDKVKARIVAGGNGQDKGLYTKEETSSPTVATASLFTILALAGHESRHAMTLDIGGAYLNAIMPAGKPVYVRLDPLIAAILGMLDATYIEFIQHDGSVIVKLDRALYGCVESAVLWYNNLKTTLEEDGFIINEYDICVFNKTIDGKQVTVLFHVDDILATSVLKSLLNQTYTMLLDKYHEVKQTTGNVHSFLGMELTFGKNPGTTQVSMTKFINDLLRDSGVTKTSPTPATDGLFEVKNSILLITVNKEWFHSYVMKLLYLAKRVRPDILTAVAFLTSRVLAPTQADQLKLDRVLRYLNGTRDLNINLGIQGDVQVKSYIDASYAVHHDMRSHTGGVLTLGRGPIHCRSTRQKLMTKSSTEAELVGLSDGLSQASWLRNFLICQGYPPLPIVQFQDNLSTITLATKGRSTSERTRHIEIRYFWICDQVERGQLVLQHQPTDDMLADYFTKPLCGAKFRKFRSELLNDTSFSG